MTNEIKEILDRLEGRKNWYLHQQKNNGVFNDEDYMAYMLLDYITNLQKENERLALELSGYRKAILKDDKLLGLQQRINKAIEYITSEESLETFKTIESREKWLKINHKLLNILQGEDKWKKEN